MFLRWFEHRQVYHPNRRLIADGTELGRPVENVHFQANDGVRLHGWFFPSAKDSPGGGRVWLVCHGNGGNISHRLELYRTLLGTGPAVFAFDYRGYGASQGRPSEAGTYRDALAACRWLYAKGYGPGELLLFGESLGGAIASELALHEPATGLVLQGTFTSIPAIGAELFPWLPVRRFASIRYDTRARLPGLHLPLLVMHSRADRLVHFHHAEQNFAAANEPKLFRELQGDHNDSLGDAPRLQEALQGFLRLVETHRPPPPTL